MEKITQTLCSAMDGGQLVKIIFAGKRKKSLEYKKVTLRPVTIKGEYMYQAEFHYDKKVTHQNIPYYEGIDFACEIIEKDFKQVNILTETEDIQILASKPEKPKITKQQTQRKAGNLDHDKKKQYIIEDGVIKTKRNYAGGILGGITNGMPLVFEVAVKPTPSIAMPQKSVSLSKMEQMELMVKMV